MGKITAYVTQSPVAEVSVAVHWIKQLLEMKRIPWMEVDLTVMPEQRQTMLELSKDIKVLPQLYFNETLIAYGPEAQYTLDDLSEKLDEMIKDALAASDPAIPDVGIWHPGNGQKPQIRW